jgi:phosphatidylserine/phosphatidylglycerophosphate/cardiolipin synthase-like enzyme
MNGVNNMTNNLQDRFRERLQAEIMEDYLFLAEMKPRAKDKVAHMVRMRESFDKLCNFIEQAKREAYEEGKAYKFNLNKKSYRLDIITELLSEAPEDRKLVVTNGWVDGQEGNYSFNLCNNQWRTLLESKLK